MARMHSRARGQSGSTRPASKTAPGWIDYKPREIEELVVTLFNQGHTQAEIGIILRDQYGIPRVKVVTGKTIEKILTEHKLTSDIPRDLLNLIKRSVSQEKHMKENKKDYTAKRGYQLTVSKIRRLTKYYIGNGKLPADWRYTPESAALLVK
jgi:small subunit ribosomal protein S15